MKYLKFAIPLFLLATLNAGAFNKQEKEYLEQHFKVLTTELKAAQEMVRQMEAKQAELLETIRRQGEALKTMDESLAKLELQSEQTQSSLKEMGAFRKEARKFFRNMAETARASAARPAEKSALTSLEGYITAVAGDSITIDRGSNHGLKGGERLVAYLAANPNQPVAELQVERVMQTHQAQCRILSLTPGVRLDFGDIVRLQ